MLRDMITMECASWYVRDDGLVQIVNRVGKKIILNAKYSKVWENINYGIEKDELIKAVEEDISKDLALHIIDELLEKKLINIAASQDNFDLLFR